MARNWIAFLALLLALGISFAAPPGSFCEKDSPAIKDAYNVMATGSLLLAVVIALAYMAGEMMHEPRFLEWAKFQVPQAMLSVLIFIIIMVLIDIQCNMKMGELLAFASAPMSDNHVVTVADYRTMTAYDAAWKYLQWGITETEATITLIRGKMGAYAIRATTNTYESDFPFGSLGHSSAPFAGDYSMSGIHGTLLQANTMFLLGIMFQYFSLMLFTSKIGWILAILPIGLALRSMPFMRGFGGAVAAFAVAAYVIYPLMLAIMLFILPNFGQFYDPSQNSFILERGIFSETVRADIAGANYYENWVEGSASTYATQDSYPTIIWENEPWVLYRFTAFNFIRAVFFPTLGLLVMVAMVRDLSKLFGEEMDASKLLQMV